MWLEVWWHLTLTFDLKSYFRISIIPHIPFECLDLATSFSVWRYIFKISRPQFSLMSWLQSQGHVSEKAVAWNSKTTDRKLLGLNRKICYDNARSFWPWPLTLRHFHIFFRIQAVSFESLKLAASFSVWRYIFSIFRSPSSFKVSELISRSRSQNSGSAQDLCFPRI